MGAVPFVGRDEELATLVRPIGSSRTRRGVDLAVVTGEAGSGKSRLLSELIARLDRKRVLRMAGWRLERTIPFAAASGLLADLGSVPHRGPTPYSPARARRFGAPPGRHPGVRGGTPLLVRPVA